MRIIFLISMALAMSVHAAEFEFRGQTIKSETKSSEVTCGSYSIVIESEEFSFKYEGRIPLGMSLENFKGPDNIVNVKAYHFKKEKSEISPLTVLFSQNEILPGEKRAYIPTKVICKEPGVVIFYWSGGNCEGCEARAYYEFKDNGDIFKKKLLPPK